MQTLDYLAHQIVDAIIDEKLNYIKLTIKHSVFLFDKALSFSF